MVLLGAHVSVAGGLVNGPLNGAALGCESIQIFSKNQRQWHGRPLEEADARAFRDGMAEHGLQAAIVHDSYLINLASPKAEMLAKSRAAFTDEIRRADALAARGLVFHPGNHQDSGEAMGIATIAASLEQCMEEAGGKVEVLLENTAGMGTSVGYTFQHLAAIIDQVDAGHRKRLGVCFDTCHAYGAGYDITTEAGYAVVMDEFDGVVGLKRLRAFHLNDSKQPFASRKDRHDGLGLGLIGIEPFRLIVNDSRFASLPAVLEVPGGDDSYRRDLELLRSLRMTSG